MRHLTRFCAIPLLALPFALPAQQAANELVVVTASRTEQTLAEAPAAVTVLTAVDIERTPADDLGDLLRNVPGLNVAQTSARDINVTGRGATNTLANTQITLLDGRSTYLDFFGINMWDLLPMQPAEIEQIEIVRGPGSALYGANALSGVVNLITKRPKDMVGTDMTLGTGYANVLHAAGDEDFAFKVTSGYFEQSSYARPTGTVPGSSPPQIYPSFRNQGTHQKRVNARFDWGLGEDSYVTVGAGFALTDGMIHTGIGPFDIDSDTHLGYYQADWYRGDLHVGASAQMLDGNATNLLTLSANGVPLGFEFVNDTDNLEVSNTNSVGKRHVITYGGNVRTHDFELAIAPMAHGKDEYGVFVQDDIRLTRSLRFVVGLRYDAIDPLHDAVLTPRTSLVLALSAAHSLRLSYNEAFRTPSTVNSFLDVSILQALAPGVAVSADAFGNVDLAEEGLESIEIGYVGSLDNGITVTASLYRNVTRDSIDFYIEDYYGPTNVPSPGPALPPALIPCFAVLPGTNPLCGPTGGFAGLVPSDYGYRNIGRTIDRGVELSIDQDRGAWYWWANLTWQDEPGIEGADPVDVNRAPEWHANLGLGQDRGPVFWNATVNYQDSAYWADVLFARAETDSFIQVNASVGWRFRDDSLTVKLIGQNIFDAKVQQHIFGDIIGSRFDAELGYSFR